MSKQTILSFTFVLAFALALGPIALALDQQNPYYSLVLVAKDVTVNPDSHFNVSVYITGFGKIEAPVQLGIFSDNSFNLENVYVLGQLIGNNIGIYNNTMLIEFKKGGLETLFDPATYSKQVSNSEIGILAESGISDENDRNIPPILISFKASKSVEEGNHQISFTFKYRDGESWRVSKEVITVHIRSLFERNQIWVGVTGLLVAIIGLGLRFENGKFPWKSIITLILLSLIILGFYLGKRGLIWLGVACILILSCAGIYKKIQLSRKKNS